MPTPATDERPIFIAPDRADSERELPADWDELTLAERVAHQADNGAKVVRVFRLHDDGTEEQVYPDYPARAFDTAHVARDHGAGRYKGLIIGVRGRRMAGSDSFTVGEAARAMTPAPSPAGTDPALTAQLTALRDELAQVKEAAGKRRTIADMTPDELRATLHPQAQAGGINLRDVLTALPIIIPAIKMLIPKSSAVSEVVAGIEAMQRLSGGKEPRVQRASEIEQLQSLIESPAAQLLIHKFTEGRPAAPQPMPTGQPAPALTPAAAQAPPAQPPTAAPEAAAEPQAPRGLEALRDTDTRIGITMAAQRIVLELKDRPDITPDAAAVEVLKLVPLTTLRETLAKFPPYALPAAFQQVEPTLAGNERAMWLLMLESALRLAAREVTDDDDDDKDDQDGEDANDQEEAAA